MNADFILVLVAAITVSFAVGHFRGWSDGIAAFSGWLEREVKRAGGKLVLSLKEDR